MLGQAVNSLLLAGSCVGSGSLVGETGEIKRKEPSHKNRPSARGSMASDFLTGRTEEEFPQKQRQFKRHWAAQDEESSMDGWWRWLHNNVNVLDTTELHA